VSVVPGAVTTVAPVKAIAEGELSRRPCIEIVCVRPGEARADRAIEEIAITRFGIMRARIRIAQGGRKRRPVECRHGFEFSRFCEVSGNVGRTEGSSPRGSLGTSGSGILH